MVAGVKKLPAISGAAVRRIYILPSELALARPCKRLRLHHAEKTTAVRSTTAATAPNSWAHLRLLLSASSADKIRDALRIAATPGASTVPRFGGSTATNAESAAMLNTETPAVNVATFATFFGQFAISRAAVVPAIIHSALASQGAIGFHDLLDFPSPCAAQLSLATKIALHPSQAAVAKGLSISDATNKSKKGARTYSEYSCDDL